MQMRNIQTYFGNLKCTYFELFHQIPLHVFRKNAPQQSQLKPMITFSAGPTYDLDDNFPEVKRGL